MIAALARGFVALNKTEEYGRTSPDSVGSSMSDARSSLKKDKLCLVCGDRALGYNFNAVSCESCKAFFRRNAHKTIRGRCEGKCDVNVESRSFCKRCRLAKCFKVGMRKDMILNDEQKKVRKQKIIINKLRRHGSLPPEDTYAVSEKDLSDTYRERFQSQSDLDELRIKYPNLTDDQLQTVLNLKNELGLNDSSCSKSSSSKSPGLNYKPWSESKEIADEIIQGMDEEDRAVVLELNKAHEQSSFLAATHTQLRSIPTNATEFFNVAEGFVRRIIKLAKNIRLFRQVEKDDQIHILKGSVVEIMMLRSAVNYNVHTESWSLSTSSCLENVPGSAGSMSSASTSAEGSSQPLNLSKEDLSMSPQGLQKLREQFLGSAGASNLPGSSDIDTLRAKFLGNAGIMKQFQAGNGPDLSALRAKFLGNAGNSEAGRIGIGPDINEQGKVLGNTDSQEHSNLGNIPGLNALRERFLGSAGSMNQMQSGLNLDELRAKYLGSMGSSERSQAENLNELRAKFLGGNGGGMEKDTNLKDVQSKLLKNSGNSEEAGSKPVSPESKISISADILKMANSETRTLFLTYAKFIKSLMNTIYGDLLILKFLIMMSLFSPDRDGIEHRDVLEHAQETYAKILQKYVKKRFPEETTLFARVIMKLTDLRNVNEIHTKMLLKMKVEDIEPLLLEIFDLPS